MQELTALVAKKTGELVESGKVEQMIAAQLEQTIGELIRDALREYSDFGKGLREAINSSLQLNFSDLGLPVYNDFILKTLRMRLDTVMEEEIRQRIEGEMAEILSPAPAEIKLSELVEKMKEMACDGPEVPDEECTCILERENSAYFQGWVYLSEKQVDRKYEAKYRFGVDRDGEVYGGSIDGIDPSKNFFFGKLYGFSKLLFQMYAGKTRIILDDHAVDTYYKLND